MKLKYILGAFAAAALFAGCQSEPMVGTFQDLELDKAFVSIDMAGGSAVVTVKSDDAWTFTKHIDTGKKDEDGKKIYVVQRGDSWWKISQKLYKGKIKDVDIAKMNGHKASDQLEVGQELVVK